MKNTTERMASRLLELNGNPNADNLDDLNGLICCIEQHADEKYGEDVMGCVHRGGTADMVARLVDPAAAEKAEVEWVKAALGL